MEDESMKVVFVSNYFNHHQKPFCEEMHRRLNGEFVFVSTTLMREERRALGYAQDDSHGYILLAYEGKQQMAQARALIEEADVVIVGSAPNEMISERIRKGKITFRYAERPYKKKPSFIKKTYHYFHWRNMDFWKKNVYMLCASAYTACDYASVGMYKNRMYKWGYFPALKEYDIEALMSEKKCEVLMWCGRFIDWKHPDYAIRIAKKLKESGYEFRLNMIGTGVMEEELKRMVKEYHLEKSVYFLGSMPPERVREQMEETGIYLFTSDLREGWGAVLNESMNSGCAVVASHAIGSVPFLLKYGENGLIFEDGNEDDLYRKVKYLLDHPMEQKRLGTGAYDTITSLWNPVVAAERFLTFVETLGGNKQCDSFREGPCFAAEVLTDDWFEWKNDGNFD